MGLTKNELLDFAQFLDAVELKEGDPEVAKVAKMGLRCVDYSWSGRGYCTGRIYKNKQGKYYVAKTHDAVCYVAKFL